LLDTALEAVAAVRETLGVRTADLLVLPDLLRARPALWVRADEGGCCVVEHWPCEHPCLQVAVDGRRTVTPVRPERMTAVPVHAAGVVIGALAVGPRLGLRSGVPAARLRETAEVVGLALDVVHLRTELLRTEAERDHQAVHDGLTGLANRRSFAERLGQALGRAAAAGTDCGVLIVDVDRFKDLNDTLGHDVGDELLRVVATRLRGIADPPDLARLAADEFAVLVEGAGCDDAVALGRRAVRLLGEPIELAGLRVSLAVSVGIACHPWHGSQPQQLLQHAGLALEAAKAGPEAPVRLFDPAIAQTTARRWSIATALRQAVEGRRFEVVYQPLAELGSGRITGVEALLRWNHDTLGPVSPSEFMPVVEHVGLVDPVTRFVLGRALEQSAAWNDQGVELHLSVNVSARNLLDAGFDRMLLGLLEQWRVPAERITLEITESALVPEDDRVQAALERLSRHGLGLSIDDFGTGYSSLAYLRRLPVTEVKIDRSFVADLLVRPRDAVIARSILDLADRLDLDVVAEGIEDVRILELLVEMGCPQGQGFLLSPPLPGDEVPALVHARTGPGARR
jgi:diguanylate cyclase (GGDEF)-like protein